MIIQTERIVLRPFEIRDITWYPRLAKHQDTRKYLKGVYTEDVAKMKEDVEIFSKGDFENDFYFVVENIETKSIMGIVVIVRLTKKMLDVSYFLFEEYRKQGYMYESMNAAMRAIKAEKPSYYFRMVINENNISSLKLAKRLNAMIDKYTDDYICII